MNVMGRSGRTRAVLCAACMRVCVAHVPLLHLCLSAGCKLALKTCQENTVCVHCQVRTVVNRDNDVPPTTGSCMRWNLPPYLRPDTLADAHDGRWQ